MSGCLQKRCRHNHMISTICCDKLVVGVVDAGDVKVCGRGVTRSVMAAPRARIALKAAWPGVSRKVRDCWLSGIFTSKAPMCCTAARFKVCVPFRSVACNSATGTRQQAFELHIPSSHSKQRLVMVTPNMGGAAGGEVSHLRDTSCLTSSY